MDRFQIFHAIVTGSDLSSMKSILSNTIATLLRAVGAERGSYFATAGGLQNLVSLKANGLREDGRSFPESLLKRALASAAPQVGDMPMLSGASTTSTRGRIVRYAAIPVADEGRVSGIGYLERPFSSPAFRSGEVALAKGVLEDVQKLLNSSRDYEKQSFEMDTMRSKIAMSQVHLVSKHPTMINLFRFIQKLARVPATVLIQGESGTGKELVARAIFEQGGYSGPFISMNCGGIEPNLLKSELFGFVKGSFTGAQKDRPGLFKQAEDGVLFMDEIGEMPTDMQVALLRTLENGEVLAVGADAPIQVNTRVVAATHRNLKQMVVEGSFRNDLYQRLKGFTLQVPPLRDRRSDIPFLCNHFIKKYNQKFGLDFKGLSREAADLLAAMDFRSGNVRELEHKIERAMVYEDETEIIGIKYLLPENEADAREAVVTATGGTFEQQIQSAGAHILNHTINHCNGNKTKAMKMLGLSRSTFYAMLNRYGVDLQGDTE